MSSLGPRPPPPGLRPPAAPPDHTGGGHPVRLPGVPGIRGVVLTRERGTAWPSCGCGCHQLARAVPVRRSTFPALALQPTNVPICLPLRPNIHLPRAARHPLAARLLAVWTPRLGQDQLSGWRAAGRRIWRLWLQCQTANAEARAACAGPRSRRVHGWRRVLLPQRAPTALGALGGAAEPPLTRLRRAACGARWPRPVLALRSWAWQAPCSWTFM